MCHRAYVDAVDMNNLNDANDIKSKYERLQESHLKLIALNQILEEKLLRIADRGLSDKQRLLQEISQLNVRLELRDQQLEQARLCNERLKRENERFKSDISVAVNLLHCQRPSTHSSCKLDNLPADLQLKAKCHLQQQQDSQGKEKTPPERRSSGGKVIRVPISAFPSTTVIYSVPSDDEYQDYEDTVSSQIMAKVLEERRRETEEAPRRLVDHGTQTYPAFIGDREHRMRSMSCVFCSHHAPAPSHLTRLPETNGDGAAADGSAGAGHSSMTKEIQRLRYLNAPDFLSVETQDDVLPCI